MSDLYDRTGSMISLQEGINNAAKSGYFDGNSWRTVEKDAIDKISKMYLNCNNDSWRYMRKAVYRYAPTILAINADLKYFRDVFLAETDLRKLTGLVKLSRDNELKVLDRLLCSYVDHVSMCYNNEIAKNTIKMLVDYPLISVQLTKNIDQFAYWELHERDYLLSVRVSAIIESIIDNNDR